MFSMLPRELWGVLAFSQYLQITYIGVTKICWKSAAKLQRVLKKEGGHVLQHQTGYQTHIFMNFGVALKIYIYNVMFLFEIQLILYDPAS